MMNQNRKVILNLSVLLFLLVLQIFFAINAVYANEVQLTDKQARALESLNTEPQRQTTKSLRLKIAYYKITTDKNI